ncbi:hypothetical protein GGR56DRAFT_221885 [Xylariaceae sp. FL0804]|nr:hypothetical protein GGR56DRAFT_221885 [Xylariaceae sp. FL0804]
MSRCSLTTCARWYRGDYCSSDTYRKVRRRLGSCRSVLDSGRSAVSGWGSLNPGPDRTFGGGGGGRSISLGAVVDVLLTSRHVFFLLLLIFSLFLSSFTLLLVFLIRAVCSDPPMGSDSTYSPYGLKNAIHRLLCMRERASRPEYRCVEAADAGLDNGEQGERAPGA